MAPMSATGTGMPGTTAGSENPGASKVIRDRVITPIPPTSTALRATGNSAEYKRGGPEAARACMNRIGLSRTREMPPRSCVIVHVFLLVPTRSQATTTVNGTNTAILQSSVNAMKRIANSTGHVDTSSLPMVASAGLNNFTFHLLQKARVHTQHPSTLAMGSLAAMEHTSGSLVLHAPPAQCRATA